MAKLLLYGGPIYTLPAEEDPGRVEALLIDGGRVVAAGRRADLAAALGPGDRQANLEGRTAVPGFIDAHVHLALWGLSLAEVDLAPAASLDEALALLARAAQAQPPGTWIRARGLDPNRVGWPQRGHLDQAVPHHPLVVRTKDAHSLCANSAALALAGIDRHTPDPPGGRIVRGPDGEPEGILQEKAQALLLRAVPLPSPDQLQAALRAAVAAAHRHGVTGVHNVDPADSFRALQELRAAGELRLRVVQYLEEAALPAAIRCGLRSGLGDRWLRLGGIKVFSDGSLGSQTAWMLADYAGRPGWRGVPTHSPDELQDLVGQCVAAGLACAIHAIGDAANRMVLDAFAAHHEASRRQGLRHRIEHAQHLDPADIPRFGALGVVASVQPSHCPADRDAASRLLGPERCRYTYAFASLRRAGARLALGSDVPVEPLDPLAGLYAAVYRRDPRRHPDPWYPEEALTPLQALYAHTRGAAWAGGTEAEQGSLVPGMLADVAVLSHDVLSGTEEDLLACRVEATLVEGGLVYGDLAWRRV